MKYTVVPRNKESQCFQQDCLRLSSSDTRPAGERPRTPSAPLAWALAAALLLLAGFPRPALAAEQGQGLLALLARMESSYAKVVDYSAVFIKQERVKEMLHPKEAVLLKFRKPFQVYMKWISGPAKEALYVDGANNNKVVAHADGVGMNMTWSLDPKGSILMADNRHAILDIGFGFILDVMRRNIPKAIQHEEIEITRMADDSFEGRPATVVEAKFTPHEGRTYYAARMVCHIDKEYLLPVGIACYDEKDALMEQYGYKDVKINAGLTEQDFSRKNAEYKF